MAAALLVRGELLGGRGPNAEGRGSGSISEPAQEPFLAAAAHLQTCFSTEIMTDRGSIFDPGTTYNRPWTISGRLRGPERSPGGREARSIERAAADWLDSIENPRL